MCTAQGKALGKAFVASLSRFSCLDFKAVETYWHRGASIAVSLYHSVITRSLIESSGSLVHTLTTSMLCLQPLVEFNVPLIPVRTRLYVCEDWSMSPWLALMALVLTGQTSAQALGFRPEALGLHALQPFSPMPQGVDCLQWILEAVTFIYDIK